MARRPTRGSLLQELGPVNPWWVSRDWESADPQLQEAAKAPYQRRICYFAADSVETFRDLINVFQVARQLFPDLGTTPRYLLIDEITAIPEWQRAVKWVRDNTAMASDCIVVR